MASVAEIIHRYRDDIMRVWLEKARASASARGLSTVALENVIPLYLSAIAAELENDPADSNDRGRKHVESHLSSRLRQGFDLAEMVDEFTLLGRCIAERWQELPDHEWPSASDIDHLYRRIHLAIAELTEAFHRHMLEDEQSEKRYLRRLQQIGSTALHDIEKPLRERLRELLDVVMEAMEAQCAGFLVFDASAAKLELTAAVGAAPFERYATSVDPRSFLGAVAMHEQPTALCDVQSTRREIPDAVRRSGIESLLGARLPSRDALLGVIYVGFAETRELAAREIRRIGALGERIGLLLENARLFAELREKIEALDAEKGLRERLVSTLAHDLRGALTAARLAAELVPDASFDERRDLAAKIDRNIDRVDRMVRDLLDVNRIRAGEPLPLRLDHCDLGALAARVVDEARAMHGDRFRLDIQAPLRGIWSEDDLHRALWNLVTNAVKYGTPKTPIAIVLGRHDDRARISVHNLGSPIPAIEQEHIFDAYARAPTADAGGRTGWGLGLAVVRGVAEAHGGRVSLTSDAESGTTFAIELPFDARTARTSDRPAVTVH